jgi:hypothetical protein
MFTWYKEIRKLGAVFAEYPAEPGRRFVDAYREDGEVFVWIGRLHMICSSARRIARQGIATAAAVLGLMFPEVSGGAISLALPSIPKASAAAFMALTAAGTAVSDESLTTPVSVVESTTWLLSPASDFPVVFVPVEPATASTSQ